MSQAHRRDLARRLWRSDVTERTKVIYYKKGVRVRMQEKRVFLLQELVNASDIPLIASTYCSYLP